MIATHPKHTVSVANGEPAWEVATLFAAQGAWSEEEYLSLDTNHLVEFSHGHIEVLPMPSDKHQGIVFFLSALLGAYARKIGGKVLFAPLRLRLWPDKIREPDVLFLADANDLRRQNAFCWQRLWIGVQPRGRWHGRMRVGAGRRRWRGAFVVDDKGPAFRDRHHQSLAFL
jgi:hypothetical protein